MSDITEAQVTRAVAVLNTAMKHGMFPEGGIPESDAEKITESEKIVVLSQQARAVADQVGKHTVVNYQALVDILFEAEVTQGTGMPTPEPDAAAPAVSDADHARAIADELGVETGLPSAPAEAVEESAVAAPTGSAPPAAASSDDGEPHPLEQWRDQEGQVWEIDRGGGGMQVEAHLVGTTEKTLLPRGYLVARVAATVEQSSEPVPSPSPSPSPSEVESPPASATSPVSPPPPSSEEPQQPSPASGPESSLPSPGLTETVDDDDHDPIYAKLLDDVEANFHPRAMPVPMDLEEPPPGIPEDLTSIGVEQQRKLHSQYNALAARARYLRGLEAAKARDCDRLRKLHLKPAMREARATLGKDASVTEVTALAEENNPDVTKWADRAVHHSDRADAYGTFFDIYTENVAVLSRDYTMRATEEAGS